MSDENYQDVLLLYRGRVENRKKKIFHSYSIFTPSDEPGNHALSKETSWYSRKLYPCAPGHIISVKAVIGEDGTASTVAGDDREYYGQHPDQDLRQKLQIEDTSLTIKRSKRKMANDKDLDDVLQPVQVLYNSTHPSRRSAVLAYIIWYITRPLK